MSADPLRGYAQRPATTNRYSYCCQQPLDFVDLLGLSRQDAVDYARSHATDNPFARNPDYPLFGTNCANFVSQCLHAGGIQMTGDWYCYPVFEVSPVLAPLVGLGGYGGALLSALIGTRNSARKLREQGQDAWAGINPISGKIFLHSATWSAAQDQYDYFSDPKNGYINSKADITTVNSVSSQGANGVKNRIAQAAQTVEPGDLVYWVDDNRVHHATIVTDVKDGEIMITGNTDAYVDEPLSERMAAEENADQSVRIVHLKDECFDE